MALYLKDFTPRLYQETIFSTSAEKNTLVVLPTGLGKTNIFLMLASHRLNQYPKSKVVLLGPSRPLIDQYNDVFKRHFNFTDDKYAVLTGMVPPEKRKDLWQRASIIFSTPQGLENDIISGNISFSEVSLIGFDEAHRAVKNYSYVWIAQQYMKTACFPRILALTASPGDDMETIKAVMQNLFIEAIEVRTESDSDVEPYVQEVNITYEHITLPAEVLEVQKYIEQLFINRINSLKKSGFLTVPASHVTKSVLLSLQSTLHHAISDNPSTSEVFQAVSLAAESLKIHHALELAETQTMSTLLEYLHQIQMMASKGANKAVQRISKDPLFNLVLKKVESLVAGGFNNPKISRLIQILSQKLRESENFKAIVFTQYRDTGSEILANLKKNNIQSRLFVGQTKKKNTGLTQKEQKRMTDSFKRNEFSVLVSSSVGEEGLDIPAVDLVVFFEPIPSVIRKIQRSGRTGRLEEGNVTILMAKGTRDETYNYVSMAKEKRMYRAIENLKKTLHSTTLMKYSYENKSNELARQVSQETKAQDSGHSPSQTAPMHSLQANHAKNTADGSAIKEVKIDKEAVVESAGENRNFNSVDSSRPLVVVDYREKGNQVIKDLLQAGAEIRFEAMDVGDYLLSRDVVVEFKAVRDFVASIIDGRLMEQVRNLSKMPKPLLVIEGTEDIYSQRNIHPNAIRGVLAAIALSFRIPIIQTKSPKETASLFFMIAKKEADGSPSPAAPHKGKPQTVREMQEYLVSSLPGIGSILSVPLLSHFGTIQKIANASTNELQGVELIGGKKAKAIHDIFNQEYQK